VTAASTALDPDHSANAIFDHIRLDRSSSDAEDESAAGRGRTPNTPGAVTSTFGLY
jgi:hypothetical protein